MYYSDKDWDIWEDLQDGTVRLVFGTVEGPKEPGQPLRMSWVESTWGPLEIYPPES